MKYGFCALNLSEIESYNHMFSENPDTFDYINSLVYSIFPDENEFEKEVFAA